MRQIDIGTGITQYFADRDGNIYWQYQSNFKPMNHQTTDQGYRYTQVGGHRHLVHRLIAKAYIPNSENKKCVNHIDGDKLNNRVSNLEWVTHSENMKYAVATGLWERKGSKQNNAKLTETIVEEILRRLQQGETGTSLAKEYGVVRGRIYDIKHGRAWSHVSCTKGQ